MALTSTSPASYTVRPGTIDSGRDYEYRMTTLMALRLISPEVEEAGIAFNADGCSDFDDMIIYKKMKGENNRTVSLVQLKHQDRPKYIQLDDFLIEKGNFSLTKYSTSLGKLENDDFLTLKKMFNDNSISYTNVELILYTNRKASVDADETKPDLKRCEFLTPSNLDHFLLTNNPNGKIYFFDVNNKHLRTIKRSPHGKVLLKRLFCFTEQVDVNTVNQLILEELQKIISDIDTSVMDKFLQFIIHWAKGDLGGHYVLTRSRIVQELLGLLLDSYISEFVKITDNVIGESGDDMFNTIIENFDLILVSNFDNVLTYLRSFINQYTVKQNILQNNFKISQDRFKQLCDSFVDFKYRIVHNNVKNNAITNYDVYRTLLLLGYFPAILVINTDKDFFRIEQILTYLTCNYRLVLLNKYAGSLPKSLFKYKVLNSFSDLDDRSAELILNREVKFQGRGHVTLRSVIENVPECKTLITTNDIINILNDTFLIGDSLPSLPDIYIPRTLPKIILNFNVFSTNKNIFVVMCNDKTLFRSCIQSISNYLLFNRSTEIKESDLRSRKSLIVFDSDTKNFSSGAKLFGRNTHYLRLLDGEKDIQWLKSCDDVGPIRSYIVDISGNRFYYWLKQIADGNSGELLTDFSNSLNIISAGPGMGKSVAMNVIALHTPIEFWILRINLIKFFDYFHNLNLSHGKACIHLKYFNKKLLEDQNCNSKLNKEIFQYFLNNKKVLILLDGFDEISPVYNGVVTQLIHVLKCNEYKIWLTTRPVMKSHIEKQFNSLAYSLNVFTEKNLIDFLFKHFSMNIAQIDDNVTEKIKSFIRELLELAKNNLGANILDFMGIPLQTKMLADVYLKNCRDYVETDQSISRNNLDILHLYEQFIDLRKNEFILKVGSERGLHILKLSDEYYKLYAVKIIFSSVKSLMKRFVSKFVSLNTYSFDISCDMNEKLNRFSTELKDATSNLGVVIPHDQLKLCFVHITFAEYYAAVWLSENYKNSEFAVLLKKILEPGFDLVRNFFDRIITKDLPLHTAVMNLNLEQVRNIVKSKTNCVTEKDGLSRTPLYLLSSYAQRYPIQNFNMEIKFKFVEESSSFKTTGAIAKLLIAENFSNIESDVCKYVSNNHCLNIINEFTENIHNINVLKWNVSAYLCFCVQYDLVNLISLIFKKYSFAKNQINDMFIIVDGDKYNLFQLAILLNKPKIIEVFIEHIDKVKIRSVIKPNQIAEFKKYEVINFVQQGEIRLIVRFLFGQDNLNVTILRDLVAESKYHLINLLAPITTNYANCHEFGCAVFMHSAAECGRNTVIELLLSNGVNVDVQNNRGDTPLHTAVFFSQNLTIELLVLKGANVNLQNSQGDTPLQLVNFKNSNLNSTIQLLLSKGANVNLQNENGETLLHKVAYRGGDSVIEILLSNGANIYVEDNKGNTPLCNAFAQSNDSTIDLFLSKGANVNLQNEDGNTLLHKAVYSANNSFIILLLSKGADVYVQNNKGNTPLEIAFIQGHDSTIELFLSKGANVNLQDKDGNTLLHKATFHGKNLMIDILLSNGADISIENNKGNTPLDNAFAQGHDSTIDLFLSKGANINFKHKDGTTLLHKAAYGGKISIIKLLLSKAANIDAQNNKGNTPLYNAIAQGHDSAIELLLSQGANVNLQNKDGNTLLHKAAYSGETSIIKILLLNGADFYVQNNIGYSPLDNAFAQCRDSTIELFLSQGANVNFQNNDGNALLHRAAGIYGIYAIELLLSKGANINLQNNFGNTPLHMVLERNENESLTIELLLAQGANVNLQNNAGNAALHMVLERNENVSLIIELLLAQGANVNLQNNAGNAALHLVNFQDINLKSTIEVLILKGAVVNLQNNQGETPLHKVFCRNESENSTVGLLLSNGANVNLQNNKGNTALHLVNFHDINLNSTIELLLSKGANVNIQNDFGNTPLHKVFYQFENEDSTLALPLSSRANVKLQNNKDNTPLHLVNFQDINLNSTVELLLSKKPNVNLQNRNGCTILHLAAYWGETSIIEMLFWNGANINIVDNEGNTPLDKASVQCNPATMELLLLKGAQLSQHFQ